MREGARIGESGGKAYSSLFVYFMRGGDGRGPNAPVTLASAPRLKPLGLLAPARTRARRHTTKRRAAGRTRTPSSAAPTAAPSRACPSPRSSTSRSGWGAHPNVHAPSCIRFVGALFWPSYSCVAPLWTQPRSLPFPIVRRPRATPRRPREAAPDSAPSKTRRYWPSRATSPAPPRARRRPRAGGGT